MSKPVDSLSDIYKKNIGNPTTKLDHLIHAICVSVDMFRDFIYTDIAALQKDVTSLKDDVSALKAKVNKHS